MAEILTNNAKTTLAEELDASETAIDVTDGSVFPSTGNFRVKVGNEIMLCTSRATNTLTVTRGVESTTATVHPNGIEIIHILTAEGLDEWFESKITSNYILIRDEKAQDTDGGTFTSGAWRTRDLNTEVYDGGSLASVASNQITLEAGTYRICAHAPCNFGSVHQIRLQNITDATTTMVGTSEYAHGASSDGSVTRSFINGSFTIASQKVFELQHICSTTQATNGFGVAVNASTEVYSVVELWRMAD